MQVNYILTIANRWNIQMSLPVEGIDAGDQFVFDLAIASESPIILTYNIKHFHAARGYGVVPMLPGEFLRLLEKMQ